MWSHSIACFKSFPFKWSLQFQGNPPNKLSFSYKLWKIIFIFNFLKYARIHWQYVLTSILLSISRKKSVDDLLSSSQDVINQAISLTSSSLRDSKTKNSPGPAKKSHKRDKSDASILSTEYVELVSYTYKCCQPIDLLFIFKWIGSRSVECLVTKQVIKFIEEVAVRRRKK